MRVATDIGGTFTDIVTVDQRGICGWKVLSTPQCPDSAVVEAISTLSGMSSFSHGTTVATNALLERKGAKVAFVTTKGFKDLLYIARQKRPRLYDFDCARPTPLVGRTLCFEVDERLAPDGSVITPLTKSDADTVADQIARAGAVGVAICLLFSYKNPSHEILLEKACNKKGLSVSRSSEIVPEFREFERASTTTMNAFVQPIVRSYTGRIKKAIKAAKGPPDYYIMKSGGGVATSGEVQPVELALSGPAGGVSGGTLLAHRLGRPNVATFDMGGTSADFSAIVDYTPLWTDEGEIDGLPMRLPILDITTIGAGGGSIAWTDKGGALRVGPQSAGSDPGPACYGGGGTWPTVTDANLLSGLLGRGSFSGTTITLDPDKARQALSTLARSAGITLDEAILGVRSVVNANMLRGIRRATVEKGIDVRDCTLLAFGGAGPLHATDLARELGVREVLVPPMAGMFSALGILLSDVRLDFGESLLAEWNAETRNTVEGILGRFRKSALQSLARQGLANRDRHLRPALDLRYKGQSFHLPVAYGKEADMKERFCRAFSRRYGYTLDKGHGVEVVAVRLTALVSRQEVPLPEPRATTTSPLVTTRRVLLASGWHGTPVYQRKQLGASFHTQGPAIIEDEGCTLFVSPGCEVSLEKGGCLRIGVDHVHH
ncbi:MAG: hydantoinase/oxoprolinase family protein [Thermodesulfobacteriota bacterium]|nr:hydantoinase/oxoprolinase family protein [Thermodesulfobacteriota bacterium]